MKDWVGFDIEIAKELTGTDWAGQRPFGITCAALFGSNGFWRVYWAGKDEGRYKPKMSKEEVSALVDDLLALVFCEGTDLVTWNGLHFEFSVLAEEGGDYPACTALAKAHYDPMFQFYREHGYPVGLDTVAKSMGLPGKPEGMSGALAPVLWITEPERVVEYVIQDAKTTSQLATELDSKKYLRWTSKTGNAKSVPFPGLLTVADSLRLPDPDQGWMTTKIPLEHFTGWMKGESENGTGPGV